MEIKKKEGGGNNSDRKNMKFSSGAQRVVAIKKEKSEGHNAPQFLFQASPCCSFSPASAFYFSSLFPLDASRSWNSSAPWMNLDSGIIN